MHIEAKISDGTHPWPENTDQDASLEIRVTVVDDAGEPFKSNSLRDFARCHATRLMKGIRYPYARPEGESWVIGFVWEHDDAEGEERKAWDHSMRERQQSLSEMFLDIYDGLAGNLEVRVK